DNFVINGTVTLGGATLTTSLLNLFAPSTSTPDRFTIINNDDVDAVSGTFSGMFEGQVFTAGSSTFQISYQGGTGNDVVLTAINATNPTLEGTPGNDNFLVVRDGAVPSLLDIYLNGNLIWQPTFSLL